MVYHLGRNYSNFTSAFPAGHVKLGQVNKIFIRQKRTTSSQVFYQYLHKSKLPTLYFQQSLPRLPIPLLEKTCERYLAAVQPILSPDGYNQTKTIVSEFEKGVGRALQELLKRSDSANQHTSYISQPWFDMYLSYRSPLPINYNPVMVMKNDPKPGYNTQLTRSANLVVSSLRFMRSLRSNLLKPDVLHLNPAKSDTNRFRRITRIVPSALATYVAYTFEAFPLDMSQYNRLFGVSRIPQVNKDRIYHAKDSRHILVMKGGKLYAVNVLNEEGEIESPNIILGRLKVVLKQTATEKNPLGVMTAANRDVWAKTRQYIVDIGNAELMELIDSALFCLSLDDGEGKVDEADPEKMLKHVLAGDAVNRWFDKSISLIVGANGTAAVNFEHSWGEELTVLRYINEIYKETIESPHIHPNTVPFIPLKGDNGVRLIELHLDDRIYDDIWKAQKQHGDILSSLNIYDLRYDGGINKISCKQNGVSPDAIMQLAFQLAYRQAFGNYVGTVESCSTATFRHGRTEAMRPCTMATKSFCESVLKPSVRKADLAELRSMIQICSKIHEQLKKDAAMGEGFDRHLFGLRHVAQVNGTETPSLFNDGAYKKINYNIISTSTVSSPALLGGSFGPAVPDGLGIGYSMQDNMCLAFITSYGGQRDGKLFIDSLDNALNTIRDILKKKL